MRLASLHICRSSSICLKYLRNSLSIQWKKIYSTIFMPRSFKGQVETVVENLWVFDLGRIFLLEGFL